MCAVMADVKGISKSNSVSFEVFNAFPTFPVCHSLRIKPILRARVGLVLLIKINADAELIRTGIANIVRVAHKLVCACVIVEGVPFDYRGFFTLSNKCALGSGRNVEAVIELLPKLRICKIVNIDISDALCTHYRRGLLGRRRICEGGCGEQRDSHADDQQPCN